MLVLTERGGGGGLKREVCIGHLGPAHLERPRGEHQELPA